MSTLNTRLSHLETAAQPAIPLAVHFEGDDYVTFEQQPMQLAEWQRQYPDGSLIRVVYVDDVPSEGLTL